LKIHFVKAGETLYEISMKYGVTVEAIMAANTSVTDPDTIMAGMKLVIPVKQQIHTPVENLAPNTPQVTTSQQSPQIPTYPEQVPSHSTALQAPESTVQPTPLAPTGIMNQGFTYPGQAVPPFASIPVPAQPVSASMTPQMTDSMSTQMPPQMSAPMSAPLMSAPMSMAPPLSVEASMPSPPNWSMPTGYTAYNTPYHMTNYSIPQTLSNNPNAIPNANSSVYPGMPQLASNYQPYSALMHNANNENHANYANHTNYEYYNTYANSQHNSEWPSSNPQPHGQYNQPQFSNDNEEPQLTHQQEEMAPNKGHQDKKKTRTSSTSKERVAAKPKKNTLHDQVLKLHQTRNKVNQR